MLFQIKEYCGNHEDCDRCPLLDQTADCCYLHATMPEDWDIEKLRSLLDKAKK